jgi:hypothetical protein
MGRIAASPLLLVETDSETGSFQGFQCNTNRFYRKWGQKRLCGCLDAVSPKKLSGIVVFPDNSGKMLYAFNSIST